jgi:hypothetical protein
VEQHQHGASMAAEQYRLLALHVMQVDDAARIGRAAGEREGLCRPRKSRWPPQSTCGQRRSASRSLGTSRMVPSLKMLLPGCALSPADRSHDVVADDRVPPPGLLEGLRHDVLRRRVNHVPDRVPFRIGSNACSWVM